MNNKHVCFGIALVALVLAVSKPADAPRPDVPQQWQGHSTKIIFPPPPDTEEPDTLGQG